jgi:hypothetical protein
LALPVFLVARLLTYEDNVRGDRSLAKNCLLRVRIQIASAAIVYGASKPNTLHLTILMAAEISMRGKRL